MKKMKHLALILFIYNCSTREKKSLLIIHWIVRKLYLWTVQNITWTGASRFTKSSWLPSGNSPEWPYNKRPQLLLCVWLGVYRRSLAGDCEEKSRIVQRPEKRLKVSGMLFSRDHQAPSISSHFQIKEKSRLCWI